MVGASGSLRREACQALDVLACRARRGGGDGAAGRGVVAEVGEDGAAALHPRLALGDELESERIELVLGREHARA
jgi:hypothetical protein